MTNMVFWSPSPEYVQLPQDEVHVWYADLDQFAERVLDFERLLSSDEQQRAHQFHFQRDRERFIVGRGVLRTILSRYLNRAPAQICFRYSPFGKPSLSPDSDREGLRFNLSHSNGTALYGFSSGREIGLDVEYIRENIAVLDVAQQFFSRKEIEQLLALPGKKQRAAFFHCWTRKEAYIKARGEGLSLPLDRFTVSLRPGERATLLCAGETQEATSWHLEDLTWNPLYAAAFAVEGSHGRLQCWHWEPSIGSLRA